MHRAPDRSSVGGMPIPSRSDSDVVRLRSPGEIAAVVPAMCGFVPSQSLVVMSLRGRRWRVGLTQRVDLPPPGAEQVLAGQVAARVRADQASAAAVTVWTDDEPAAGVLPRTSLAAAVGRALRRKGVDVPVCLLVGRGRWWSYDCADACCPPEGTPLDEAVSVADAVRVRGALQGRAVLPSRDALVASLAPPEPAALLGRLTACAAARRRRVGAEGRAAVGREALQHWQRALARAPAQDAAGGPEGAAQLVVSLADCLVRDAVLSCALDDDAALLALLLQLAAVSPAPFDVPVCTLVAWTAHVRGDGALANVALDRALAGDPAYPLARMGRAALDSQVAPSRIRALLADTRVLLTRQHPWTVLGTVPG